MFAISYAIASVLYTVINEAEALEAFEKPFKTAG